MLEKNILPLDEGAREKLCFVVLSALYLEGQKRKNSRFRICFYIKCRLFSKKYFVDSMIVMVFFNGISL